jgi:hypothetical protein
MKAVTKARCCDLLEYDLAYFVASQLQAQMFDETVRALISCVAALSCRVVTSVKRISVFAVWPTGSPAAVVASAQGRAVCDREAVVLDYDSGSSAGLGSDRLESWQESARLSIPWLSEGQLGRTAG